MGHRRPRSQSGSMGTPGLCSSRLRQMMRTSKPTPEAADSDRDARKRVAAEISGGADSLLYRSNLL